MKAQQKSIAIVGVKELRQNLDKYISQVNKGRTLTIVRRSKPVFKMSPVDEWGDDGIWETVVDFTKINPKGVPVKNVLKALKEIKKESK